MLLVPNLKLTTGFLQWQGQVPQEQEPMELEFSSALQTRQEVEPMERSEQIQQEEGQSEQDGETVDQSHLEEDNVLRNEVATKAKKQLDEIRGKLVQVQEEFICNMNQVVQNFMNKLTDNMHERSVKCHSIMAEVEELFEKNNNARQQLNQTKNMTYSLFSSVSERNLQGSIMSNDSYGNAQDAE